MDTIILNINNDYENEMNLSNEQGIKYYSNRKAIEFLKNLENQSNKAIENIKSRINNFILYESYTENIDEINNINNKTILEYIYDIYNNFIYNSLDLKAEYLNETSNINKNKDKLFQISKNIVSEINKEINDIDIYIENYTFNYLENNIFTMYYNLYYIRKPILDGEMSSLLNEFYLLLNRTINIHFKSIMNYNYNLLNQVLYEEDLLFSQYIKKKRRMFCSGFVKRFEEYKAKFENYLILTYSEEFLNLLQKYFFKIRDDLLNYVNNKLLSINTYYFDNNLYKKNFYYIEQINNEIKRIIDNINNYYNTVNLDRDIKLKALDLSQKILEPFHNKKIKDLDNYYNYLYGRTTHYNIYNCNIDQDFVFSKLKFLFSVFGFIDYYFQTKHTNNINLVIVDLKKTNEYLKNEVNSIINNFTNKIDVYLNNYISICQILYDDLYKYVENKINNSNIQILGNHYINVFNKDIINMNSNDNLLERFCKNKSISNNNINNSINILKGNINLLKNRYFDLYYLQTYDKFLEYLEEIIYKINQFMDELIKNLNYIKYMVNYIYKKRISNIQNTTISYVNNFLKMHFN